MTIEHLHPQGIISDYYGSRHNVLADATTTNGAYSLIDLMMRKGEEPPPHTHTKEDEAFLIISGEWNFRRGEERFVLGPMEYIFLPRNVPHAVSVNTNGARALTLFAPPGIEDAFRELGRPFDGHGLPPAHLDNTRVEDLLRVMKPRGIIFHDADDASTSE